MAVNTATLAVLQAEVDRCRAKIHQHSSELASIALLSAAVQELRDELPNLARQAAREAVTEMVKRRRADTFANWRLILAALSTGAAIGALIVAIALH